MKTIYITVVGYGKHGKEFVKSLLWYCQLPEYKVDLTIIDSDDKAESKFKAEFPEIKLNRDFDLPSDMRYRISFEKITFGTEEFISKISEDTRHKRHFFVCLGDDSLNTHASLAIRLANERVGNRTSIVTVIRNDDSKKLIENDSIKVIGDFKSYYSIKNFSSDNSLISSGLEEHSIWDKIVWEKIELEKHLDGEQQSRNEAHWINRHSENTYNFNDYNFYSSISKSIHRSLRSNMNAFSISDKYRLIFENTATVEKARAYHNLMSELYKKYEDHTLENPDAFKAELCSIAEIEHVRWNAHMRSEGWIIGEKRRDSIKVHPKIVSVERLPDEEILKDI